MSKLVFAIPSKGRLMEATPEVALTLDSPQMDRLRALSKRAALAVGFVEEAAVEKLHACTVPFAVIETL